MKIAAWLSLTAMIVSKVAAIVLSVWALVEFILFISRENYPFKWASVIWLVVSIAANWIASIIVSLIAWEGHERKRKSEWEERVKALTNRRKQDGW